MGGKLLVGVPRFCVGCDPHSLCKTPYISRNDSRAGVPPSRGSSLKGFHLRTPFALQWVSTARNLFPITQTGPRWCGSPLRPPPPRPPPQPSCCGYVEVSVMSTAGRPAHRGFGARSKTPEAVPDWLAALHFQTTSAPSHSSQLGRLFFTWPLLRASVIRSEVSRLASEEDGRRPARGASLREKGEKARLRSSPNNKPFP